MYEQIVSFIRSIYGVDGFVPLHEPRFAGNEKKYVMDCLDSTMVSSIGEYVDRFERMICEYTGVGYAVATVNGTVALHVALKLAGVNQGDEVITQPLSFVATANAISYCGASHVFLDVDKETLGLSPDAVRDFLEKNTEMRDGSCFNTVTGKRVSACVPVHIFGHPCRIDELVLLCRERGVPVVEDAAESLGSTYKGRHTGSFGDFGVLSLNGNKIVTSGGGGAVITNDESLARKAKHITTTARVPHQWEYVHDMVGFNFRMPNINAALACAQLEQLDGFIDNKRKTAAKYAEFFEGLDTTLFKEPENACSNYWLNAVIMRDRKQRDEFLEYANSKDVMCRPVWRLMNEMEMFSNCQKDDLVNSKWLESRLVDIPSSVRV